MSQNGSDTPINELDEISNMSVSSFLSKCGAIIFKLENDISKELAISEAKEFLGNAGVFLLGDNITDPGIRLPEMLKIDGEDRPFSSLIDEYSNADQEIILKVVRDMKKAFPTKRGNYSLDDIVRDMLYAQDIFEQAIIFQIIAFYPLNESIVEVEEDTKGDTKAALEKKSYADLDLDELDRRFEFLTVDKREKAIQACVDKGWLTERDSEKIVINEKEEYIGIYFGGREVEIEMDDDSSGTSFFETSTEDTLDAADWELISRQFVKEIETLRKQRKEADINTTKGEKHMLEIANKMKELQKERDIAINFFVRNVLNMREEEYIITRRGGAYVDDSLRGTKQILSSSLHDKVQTVRFRNGIKITSQGPARIKQGSFIGGLESFPIITGGDKFPIRRKRIAA